MIKHCNNRQLGEFDYDDALFRVEVIEDDKYDSWDNLFCLRYIGQDPDCSVLALPRGLWNARYMFEGTCIEKPPVIPFGVANCEAMFKGTLIQYAPELPGSVIKCDSMFEFTSIQTPPMLPKSVKSGFRMFASCPNLSVKAEGCPREFEEMYRGCDRLREEELIAELSK